MKRELWTSALLGAVLLLGAPEARAAAGPLVAGPLFHFDGDTVTCQAVNTTTRAIENVLVRFRDKPTQYHTKFLYSKRHHVIDHIPEGFHA